MDIDTLRVAALRPAHVLFHEAGLAHLVRAGIEAQRLSCTDRHPEAVSRSEFLFIAVNTPSAPEW